MALAELIVGPLIKGIGTQVGARGIHTGEMGVSDVHGRYAEAVRRGNVYTGANQAGQAITNLLSAATGLILYNPIGSGVNLELLEILFGQTSVAAAAANALLALAANVNPTLGAPTTTTALAIRNAQLGNQKSGVGQLFSVATIGAAPVLQRPIWQPSVSATATTAIPPVVKDEVAGAVVVGPGCCVSLTALSALSGVGSFTWEEVPLAPNS